MAKGGKFENEVFASLSAWWTAGERDDVFCRSAGSGSRFTARRKKGKDTANMGGDMTFNDPIGEPLVREWNVECKTGYSGRNKVRDADGNIIRVPVYSQKKARPGEAPAERKIIRYKDKTALAPWDALDRIDSSQKETTLEKMWGQCHRDACLTGRIPVLIFRRNMRKVCIALESSYANWLIGYFGHITKWPHVSFHAGEYDLVIMSLAHFMEWIPNIRAAISTRK